MTTPRHATPHGPASLFGRSVAFFGIVSMSFSLLAKNGAYSETKHGNPASGVRRRTDIPPGDCGQCHDDHSTSGGERSPPHRHSLFTDDDNELCFSCHNDPGAHRIWPGGILWSRSGHALSSRMTWPGPQPASRPSSDSGKCINCHDPHGDRDGKGLIPSMLAVREEQLCTRCHDGLRGADIRRQLQQRYTHPIGRTGRHDVAEGSDRSRFGTMPDNRHAECSDCHNSHSVQGDQIPPSAPAASARITGVSRIQVTNGAAGTAPIYTWRSADERSFENEYEICFKCHSGWTTQPAGQSDLALLTNPSNASYHPIQAAGKNRNIDPAAFTTGWSWDRGTYCTDCHTGDDSTVRGPHGSAYRYILKKSSPATPQPQTMPPDDLCFDCHSYDVYGNATASAQAQRASRFNAPNIAGHAYHTGGQQIPCFACHETHGSVRNAALISTRRMPGVVSYLQTPTGGTCTSTCHAPRTYTVNYPR